MDCPALLTLTSSSRTTCTGVPFGTVRGIVSVIAALASGVAVAGAETGLLVSTGFEAGADAGGGVSWAYVHAAPKHVNKTAQRIRPTIIHFLPTRLDTPGCRMGTKNLPTKFA